MSKNFKNLELIRMADRSFLFIFNFSPLLSRNYKFYLKRSIISTKLFRKFENATVFLIQTMLLSGMYVCKKFWKCCNNIILKIFSSDLNAVRRLMSNDATPLLSRTSRDSSAPNSSSSSSRKFGENLCPSCRMPFDKAKKRRLVDTCGHERCYACMFRNETCPICVASGK